MDEPTKIERLSPARRAAKPGALTSEFAGAVAAASTPYLIPGVPPDTAARVSGLVAAVYVVARTVLKIVALFKR